MSIFKWNSEFVVEVEMPLQRVWEYYLDFNNWAKGDKRIEYFSCDTKLDLGAQVKGKIKGRPTFVTILVTNFREYERLDTLTKAPFFKQETTFIIEEMSSEKTKLKQKVHVSSPFTLFMKGFYEKHVTTHKDLFLKGLNS